MRALRSTATIVTCLSVAAVACVDLSYLSEGGELTDAGNASQDSASLPDVTTGGSDTGSDATLSPEDGGADADATPPNLLTNGDFEFGCAAWGAAFGSVQASSTARSGAGSCKFCMGSNWEAFFEQTVKMPVAANETYVAEVWTQGAMSPSDLTDAGFYGEMLYVTSLNTSKDSPSLTPASATWQRLTALVKTTAASDAVTVSYRLQQQQPAKQSGGVVCILVDDASLRRMP
ncbi:hypothetical protein [Labilithrix luteola]|uniref:hypothetical protein n=1 Tax=Labilithrix luteola TaxID=1391654 RepID=UPI0011BA80C3|nr:hypothetical protein [Labilithrix luteola]